MFSTNRPFILVQELTSAIKKSYKILRVPYCLYALVAKNRMPQRLEDIKKSQKDLVHLCYFLPLRQMNKLTPRLDNNNIELYYFLT